MIVGIILAAGESKRFSTQNKLLYDINLGKSVIESTILAFLKSNINKIILVTGHDSINIVEKIQNIISTHQKPIRIVFNDNYKSGGMSSSVIAGLKYVRNANAVLITPGDIPLIPPATINSIISLFLHKKPDIIIPTFKERKGHPILFKSTLFDELRLISEEKRGLKEITTKYREKILFLPTQDSGILKDLDTMNDLKKFSR